MNIFSLDSSPKVAAEYISKCHLLHNKMITESSQLLGTAIRLTLGSPGIIRRKKFGLWVEEYYPYCIGDESKVKAPICLVAYKNHPCNIWVRESLDNFIWLTNYTKHLVDLYGKFHNSSKYVNYALKLVELEALPLPSKGLTEFARAFKDLEPDYSLTAHEDYKRYMLETKWYLYCEIPYDNSEV